MKPTNVEDGLGAERDANDSIAARRDRHPPTRLPSWRVYRPWPVLFVLLLAGVGVVAATAELDFPGHIHECHTNNADWCTGPDGAKTEHWRHDEDGHKHWVIFG